MSLSLKPKACWGVFDLTKINWWNFSIGEIFFEADHTEEFEDRSSKIYLGMRTCAIEGLPTSPFLVQCTTSSAVHSRFSPYFAWLLVFCLNSWIQPWNLVRSRFLSNLFYLLKCSSGPHNGNSLRVRLKILWTVPSVVVNLRKLPVTDECFLLSWRMIWEEVSSFEAAHVKNEQNGGQT